MCVGVVIDLFHRKTILLGMFAAVGASLSALCDMSKVYCSLYLQLLQEGCVGSVVTFLLVSHVGISWCICSRRAAGFLGNVPSELVRPCLCLSQ